MILPLTLLAATAPQEARSTVRFDQLMTESRLCLEREVAGRITPALLLISEDERVAVREGAVLACHDFDVEMARETTEFRSGAVSLEDAAWTVLTTSVRLADAMVIRHVRNNIAETTNNAPNR